MIRVPREAKRLGIPADVWRGMYVAAWARAEHCPVYITEQGGLELYVRHEPSDALARAWVDGVRLVRGVIGWAVPIIKNAKGRASFASWPSSFFTSGKGARS